MEEIKKIIVLSVGVSSVMMAGGYRLPEQSIHSGGLSDAYVAHTMGADTAYYNPAAMVFMGTQQYFEAGMTLVTAPAQTYTLIGPFSGKSERENIPMPTAFYVSKPMDNMRWGLSLVVPAGSTKRWKTPYQKLFSEEFTLKNIEVNPTVAYKVSEEFAVGAGLRVVYSQGVVNSDGGNIAPVKREMEGDTIAFGYNVALMYNLVSNIHLAMTYRSNIDVKEEGQANLYFGKVGQQYDAEVTVPLPAALNIGISKTWQEWLTIELKYERIYWSAYKTLDFEYDRPIQAGLYNTFDKPLRRHWHDTDSFRIGATMKVNDKLTVLAGAGIDESPVPLDTIGFELADSDAKIFSLGFRYQQTKNLSWGVAFLMSKKDSIALKPGVAENTILSKGGTFTDGGAFLTTIGMAYTF